jgi:hypothetical protein
MKGPGPKGLWLGPGLSARAVICLGRGPDGWTFIRLDGPTQDMQFVGCGLGEAGAGFGPFTPMDRTGPNLGGAFVRASAKGREGRLVVEMVVMDQCTVGLHGEDAYETAGGAKKKCDLIRLKRIVMGWGMAKNR